MSFYSIKIVNDNLDAYLKKSKVLISAASTICFESIACGIPTIVIEIKSELNRNPIPYDINPIIWRVCYEKSAFIKSINLFLSYGIKKAWIRSNKCPSLIKLLYSFS